MKNTFSDDLFFQTRLQAKVAGELQGDALEELNATIGQSPEAAEEARFSHRLAEVLRHEDKFKMSAMLATIIAEEGLPPSPNTTVKGDLKKILNGAGIFLIAAALVVAIVYKMKINSEMGTNMALYSEYYTPFENVIVAPDNPTGLEQGMAAYDNGDYAKAIELLSSYYQKSGDANAALYLGVSHLELGDAQSAAKALQNGIGNLPQPALDACQWYLALAYLKMGDFVLAKGLLNMIQRDGIYGKKAEELLVEIGRLE